MRKLFLTAAVVTAILISCKKDPPYINKPPVAKAGADQVILIPKDSSQLNGGGSVDADGYITSWTWTQKSGPTIAFLEDATRVFTKVSGLRKGTYEFELTVKDNTGQTGTDIMQIRVDSLLAGNNPPVARAGGDQLIILPSNQVYLNGSGSSDPDNNIVGYAWTRVAGPSQFAIGSAFSQNTQVTNLVAGNYEFELRVIDAGNLVSRDTVAVTVQDIRCDQGIRPTVIGQLLPVTNLPVARMFMGTGSFGNKIFYAGGYEDTYIVSSKVDILDVTNNSLSSINLSFARGNISSLASGNKLIFAGGDWIDFYDNSHFVTNVDIYNLSNNSLTTIHLPKARSGIAMAATADKIFFAGGYDYTDSYDAIDIYDMNSNSWLSSIPIAGGNGVSVETLNNKIYFAGGRKFINFTNTLVTDNIYVYDIISTTWSLQHLSEPKFNMAHTIVANKIMWGGGLRFNNSAVCDVQFFDPVNNSSTSSNLYSGQEYWDRYNPTAYIKNNKVVIPRFGSYPHYNRFDIYDLNTGGWSFGQVNDDLYGPSIISINNVIYIAGGYYNGTLSRQVWKLEF